MRFQHLLTVLVFSVALSAPVHAGSGNFFLNSALDAALRLCLGTTEQLCTDKALNLLDTYLARRPEQRRQALVVLEKKIQDPAIEQRLETSKPARTGLNRIMNALRAPTE